MSYDRSTTGDQVNLHIHEPTLPTDKSRRNAVLQDLENAVTNVLAKHGLEANHVRGIDGHTYASIKPDCPACGESLRLVELELEYENWATARATCDCGWRGDAKYRLIDLDESTVTNSEEDDQSEEEKQLALLEDTGCVSQYGIRPLYVPY